MAEPENIQLGDMEMMPSVIGAAFERSGIHYEKKDFVNPLGMEPVDWFMHNICAGAGINIELLNEAPNQDRYTWAQIVDPDEMNEQLKKKDPEVIAYSPEADMHGVVIKLGMNHKWRVTVTEENLEQHVTSVRGSRRPVGLPSSRAPSRTGTRTRLQFLFQMKACAVAPPPCAP